jgi:hypothetical protein
MGCVLCVCHNMLITVFMSDTLELHLNTRGCRQRGPLQETDEYAARCAHFSLQGAPLNEADHCGDPPLLLAAGNGATPPSSC